MKNPTCEGIEAAYKGSENDAMEDRLCTVENPFELIEEPAVKVALKEGRDTGALRSSESSERYGNRNKRDKVAAYEGTLTAAGRENSGNCNCDCKRKCTGIWRGCNGIFYRVGSDEGCARRHIPTT